MAVTRTMTVSQSTITNLLFLRSHPVYRRFESLIVERFPDGGRQIPTIPFVSRKIIAIN
jgi:hypothetical protein